MDRIEHRIEQLLVGSGIPEDTAVYLRLLILLVMLTLAAGITFWITRRIVIAYMYKLVRRSSVTWDDMLADHNVFNNLAHFIPALFVKVFAQAIFNDFPFLLPAIIRITDSYLVIVGLTIVLSFLRVAEFVLAKSPAFVNKPLNSYFQLTRIILYIVTGILVLSVLLGKSPVYFLSAFGAMTAILLLVFKDTIMGLVASVQISSNDMVRVGDWVEMPKFNADGSVIAINLNTVKVQNWDKTITTIPTYYFITDSFKNWRGMVESGGRRIKRSVFINSQTVRFVDPETREQYKKYHLLTEYITQRQQEIEEYNSRNGVDTTQLINGRRMTNIGIFRRYIEFYLKHHPGIRQDMTLLVRQLAIEDRGIPIEIYCFTRVTAWADYETVQADVFDHILAAASFFGLEIFQQPSGKEIASAAEAFIRAVKQ